MVKRDRTAEALARLEEAAVGPDVEKALRKALESNTSLVAARAADLVREQERADFVPLLAAAFRRFLAAGMEGDKGCRAKEAIVRALDALEAREHDIYVDGIRHVQLEPQWGPIPADTAVGLRNISAVALVNSRHPELMKELARLLADNEHRARAGAAHAIGASGRLEGVPLLIFKAFSGDREPEVLTEVFSALLAIEEDQAIELVASFLEDQSARLAAAVALGQSRRPAALAPLLDFVARPMLSPEEKKAGFLAVAMLRTPEAIDRLLAAIREESARTATLALEAVGIYKHDPALLERIQGAVKAREDRALEKPLREMAGGRG